MDDLIEEFITETSAALTQLEPALAAMKKKPSAQPVPDAAYDLLRSVKSAGGFLGLPRLESLANAGEGLLLALRAGKAPLSAAQAKLVLALFGQIQGLVADLAAGGAEPIGDDERLIEQLSDATPAVAPVAMPISAAPPATPSRSKSAKSTKKTTASKKKAPTIDMPKAAAGKSVAARKKAPSSKPSVAKSGVASEQRIHIRRAAFEQLLQLVAQLVQSRNQLMHTAQQAEDPALLAPLQQVSELITALKNGMLSKQVSTNPASLPEAPKIIPSLLLVVGDQRFAIAKEQVSSLMHIGGDSGYRVEEEAGVPILRLRDRVLPLIALSDLLAITPHGKPGQGYVVLLRDKDKEIGVIVDRVDEGEELVVQPLSRALGNMAMYAGSSILGNGRVVLVLNGHAVLQSIGRKALASPAAQLPAVAQHPPSFLIFRAGMGLKAVPLERVVRLETVDAQMITLAAHGGSMPYREGTLMLRGAPGVRVPTQGQLNVIVLQQGETMLGLLADTIVDILMTPLEIGLAAQEEGYLGSAMIADNPTDIIDVTALFAQEVE